MEKPLPRLPKTRLFATGLGNLPRKTSDLDKSERIATFFAHSTITDRNGSGLNALLPLAPSRMQHRKAG